ncbi:MAG: hypothetical protein CMD84_00710 [Gammaproteobacteria bacterium]|jgi:hypothetical protein|nr:hypothetical protein [Gammaproteobacteria bacterium]|tara:strand:+ start:2714 stop:3295 length:582 start_codon:yes stop_codon:yes gene_type:complete
MRKLTTNDLLSLEDYDKQRETIKSNLINHKKNRAVSIGEHIVLLFEDFETIKYQVQEMLRIEKIFNEEEIQAEINAYQPLIPEGNNLKATMLIMYSDVNHRKIMLNKLNGIENNIWLTVNNSQKCYAIPDEDLERSNDEKTSAVHFLRFQLDEECVQDFQNSYEIFLGCDHKDYNDSIQIHKLIIKSLRKDFL